jgi:hypothetical protein
MGSERKLEDDDLSDSMVGREIASVLSELDALRLKLERLREVAQVHRSERRLKVPPKVPSKD